MRTTTATPAWSKAMAVVMLAAAMWMATVEPAIAQGNPVPEPKVLADGIGAKSGRFDDLHRSRFIEVFLAHRDAKTGQLVAECYNTLFTSNGIPASKDTAPQAKVEGLDFDRMKMYYGVRGAGLQWPTSSSTCMTRPGRE